jgi:hypothetical protein
VTADEWIRGFAEQLGMEAPDEEATGELLELAATAAHASERIAAPIACYLAGLRGVALNDARAAAERVAAE